MNNITRPVTSYDDLVKERERLKELLKIQKAQISKDLGEIREEFTPVVLASEMFGKLLNREDGKDALVATGTNLTIDLLVNKLFATDFTCDPEKSLIALYSESSNSTTQTAARFGSNRRTCARRRVNDSKKVATASFFCCLIVIPLYLLTTTIHHNGLATAQLQWH
jgi:hypothetical protein